MLATLDDEPIVVIEPGTMLGFLARISGVVDNFQFHMLLMDQFPFAAPSSPRLSAASAAVARGEGPQAIDETVVGSWNLSSWHSIGPGPALPDGANRNASRHWIWNEGKPADIPLFEERRAILLGPPSYQRSWRAQRMFDRLPARLGVERCLGRDEASAILERMFAAQSS